MKEKSKSWQNILTPQYHKKIWHGIEFPAYGKEGWTIQAKNKVTYYENIDALYPIVGAWPAQKPILVGMPGASRFVLPICVHEFQGILFQSIKRHYTFLIGFLLAFSVFPLLASTIVKPFKYFTMFISSISLAALFFCDYYFYLRTNDGFRERSEFLYWLYTDRNVKQSFFLWAFFILLTGGAQLLFQQWSGGMENLFDLAGVMFEKVEQGEFWRLVTGPFFHYSFIHFIINFSTVVMVAPISWAQSKWKTLLVFICANILGAFAQMEWSERIFDSYGGISAGVDGLIGYLIVSHFFHRQLFPKGFGIFVTGLYAVARISTDLLSVKAASIGHGAGFATGGIAALLFFILAKQKQSF